MFAAKKSIHCKEINAMKRGTKTILAAHEQLQGSILSFMDTGPRLSFWRMATILGLAAVILFPEPKPGMLPSRY
jgi:hypothetical protein